MNGDTREVDTPGDVSRDWQRAARAFLVSEMQFAGVTTRELAQRLTHMGIEVTAGALATKLSRGTYQVGFWLACMDAIAVQRIDLERLRYIKDRVKLGEPDGKVAEPDAKTAV